MVRKITVDGEAALAVDTAAELGRALLTGRYVVASDAVRAAYGLTDTLSLSRPSCFCRSKENATAF